MADERGYAAERLAAVCRHLEEIRRDLRSVTAGDDSPVERVLAAVRDGDDVADALDGLHAVLQVGGDPWGLDGYADDGSGLRGMRPEGIRRPSPGEHVYLCPGGRCTRSWWPRRATEPVPECRMSGVALRRKRL
ncbi:hypothetical protein ACH4D3_19985 [Streptomyces sp. NPDC018026]|uniref:hypothetical protein n=1 Tax=Streptomyces sp. NPDC018026 TaxID=3365031 RepID=UPI003790AD41